MPISRLKLLFLQVFVAIGAIVFWHIVTNYPVISDVKTMKFFFSTPIDVFTRVVRMFADGSVYRHLWITLVETILAFVIGASLGIIIGFWFARKPLVAAVFDPYVKMMNALPRVVLAPIFALWFGLGIWSKVWLGVTLVFFVVFFNVYQGVREVPQVVLANARMLGMNERQLLLAVVGAVVGEYLGSAAGLGYLIHQAAGVFDVTGVFAGMVILMMFVMLIDAVVTVIEKPLLVWKPGETRTV